MEIRETIKFLATFLLAALFFFIFMLLMNNQVTLTNRAAKPSKENENQLEYYNAASALTFLPGQNYEKIMATLSKKFPDTHIITIPSTIAQLPSEIQMLAVRQNILEGKIDLLLNEVGQIAEKTSEQPCNPIFQNYFMNLVGGLASIISAWIITKMLDIFYKRKIEPKLCFTKK